MADDPKPAPDAPAEKPPEPEKAVQDEDVGEFINRHIFEKDSVFFEG